MAKELMTSASGNEPVPAARSEGRSRRWQRAGIITALLWIATGAAVTRIADGPEPGTRIPDGAVWVILLAGIPILRWAGRRQGVHGRGEWLRAAGMTLAALTLGLGWVGCVAAMLTYG